jgi:hypothetical protein
MLAQNHKNSVVPSQPPPSNSKSPSLLVDIKAELCRILGSPGTFRRKSASTELPPIQPSSGGGGGGRNSGSPGPASLRLAGSLGSTGGGGPVQRKFGVQQGNLGVLDINNPIDSSSSSKVSSGEQQQQQDTLTSNKMAGDVPATPQIPWSNNKEDYELRDVIGKSKIVDFGRKC